MGKVNIIPIENSEYKDDEIVIDDVTITYSQNGDCTEDRDIPQELVVSTRNNGLSRFINIKTENWSIDGPEDLVEIINDFCKRASLVLDNNLIQEEKEKED